MPDRIWYAAYGSNLNRFRFSKYLEIEVGQPEYPVDQWMVSNGSVRMAGHSERWGGGVAIFDPSEGTAMLRRYLLTIDQYESLWSGENRGEALPSIADSLTDATIDHPEVRLEIEGAYDVSWMLDRVDDIPVFTITTSREIVPAPASDSYLTVIAEGLAEAPTTTAFRESYLLGVQKRGQRI